MHLWLYRQEIERAADEIELVKLRLGGPKRHKALSGRFDGRSVAPGYLVDQHAQSETYERYVLYSPHAEVVRLIFQAVLATGTPTRAARWLRRSLTSSCVTVSSWSTPRPCSPSFWLRAHYATAPRETLQKHFPRRLSGPLLDRIDIQVEVPPVQYHDLASGSAAESSASICARVNAARALQQQRYASDGLYCNAHMLPKHLRAHCQSPL